MTRHLASGFFALIVAAGIAGCGMNGSSSKAGGFGDGSVPPPNLDTANPPYSTASSNDLSLWYSHVHQDYYGTEQPPQNIDFYFSVHSTFDHAVDNVEYMLRRLDGPAQAPFTGVLDVPANNAGGDGHEHVVNWVDQAPGGRHYYELLIDPNNRIAEARKSNNRYVFVVDVPSTRTRVQNGDLEFYAKEAHVHTMMPNNQFDVHFEVQNTSDHDMNNVEWRLQCPDIGFDQTFTIDKIPANSIYGDGTTTPTLQQILHISAQGMHDITLTLDPNNHISETNENDNVRVFHILVGPPAGSG